VLNSVKIPTV